MWLGVSLDETGEESGQESPKVGEDLADVVSAAAEDGEEGIAEAALERAAIETSVGFHVADLGLDGAAALEEPGQPRRQTAPGSADEHPRALHAMSAVAAVDHGEAGAVIGQGLGLLEGLAEGVLRVPVDRDRQFQSVVNAHSS